MFPSLPLKDPVLLCTKLENKAGSANSVYLPSLGRELKVKGTVFINKPLHVEDLKILANFCRDALSSTAPPIKLITIRDALLGDDSLEALLELLEVLFRSGSVQVLNVRNNRLSKGALLALMAHLSTLRHSLHQIVIDGNPGYLSLSPEDKLGFDVLRVPLESTPQVPLNPTVDRQTNRGSVLVSDKPIIVVGAGIAGSAVGAALASLGYHNFRILERDAGSSSRSQGYGITIQQGMQALLKMDLTDKIYNEGVRSTSHWIFDHHGLPLSFWYPDRTAKVCPKKSTVNSYQEKWFNYHIPRSRLRSVLLEKAGGDTVVDWGANIVSIEDSAGEVRVGFTHGCSTRYVDGCCLIDCSGIKSAVRGLVCGGKEEGYPMKYLGVLVILGITECHQDLEGRIIQISDGESRLFAMPFDRTRLMWQLSKKVTLAEAKERSSCPESLHATAIEWTAPFEHPIRECVATTDKMMVTGTPVYGREAHAVQDLPVQGGLQDKVTFIGDSAHPMSPFKGQGANQAIIDAYNLSQLLLSDSYTIKESMIKISEDMFSRVSSKVSGSAQAIDVLHGPQFLELDHHVIRKGLGSSCVMQKVIKMRDMNMTALTTTKEEYDAMI
eukprot:GHVH01005217.1.p1 GENE.GHVH01005217.1~~GHVH01005217.1.p1  ORF type:complete len:610 (+),score=81.14 GHVH01005217.1:2309-4138(+)